MSYARWGWNGSDVYVFATSVDSKTVLECCGCRFTEVKLDKPYTDMFGIEYDYDISNFYADTRNRMVEHLWKHKKDGDTVLDETLQHLVSDFPDGEKLVDDYDKEGKF